MHSAQSCPVDSRSDVSEADEFLDDLVESWVEVYKKSATTVFLLRIISKEEELSTAQILTRLSEVSGWSFTERGLYRTLQRLVSNYLLAVDTRPGVRSGLKRKVFTVTDFGRAYLARIEAEYRK